MQRTQIDFDLADEDVDGFASAVTGATFTLTANYSTDSLAHKVTVLNNTVNDHSGKTLTIVGLDPDSQVITETITGPGASATVTSSKYYSVLASVTPSATIGVDTFDIGWADEASSKTIPLNYNADDPATVAVDATGTIDFSIQQCFDMIQRDSFAMDNANWFGVVTGTADSSEQTDVGATAARVIANSYSSGAELQIYCHQAVGR